MDPNTQIGGYRIVGKLGAGGMGEVYRAHDEALGRDVAIKLLPAEVAADPQRLSRLKREARALAALDHANIATVHGFEEESGTSFIVMELIEGPSLRDRLTDGALPLQDALGIALQIADALKQAHDRGIVHRDLKPDNIKVSAAGRVKVLDFGLAKKAAPGASGSDSRVSTQTVDATATGAVMGTPPYMSPEQVRGQGADARTDVWALGCVLYECLAGRRAFGRETAGDTLAAVLGAEPPMDAFAGAAGGRLERLLRRMLAKSVDERIRSMQEVRTELEHTIAGLGGDPSAARSNLLRRLGPPLGAVLAATLLVVLWTATQAPMRSDLTDRTIAVLPFETLGQAETTTFTDGVHVDMLTRLSKVADLRVTSRLSVLQYRDASMPLPEIARELGVTWVLLGEVQEVGNEVQVNARLLQALEDRQVWAESYRRTLSATNLFDIQNEITREIAAQLQSQLDLERQHTANRAPTEDLEAYRLYIRGRTAIERWSEASLRRATDYFQRAVEQDPDYALAWAGLADAASLLRWYAYAPVPGAPAPEEAADTALSLDPDLAEAHLSDAIVMSSSRVTDGPAALRALDRALELRPSFAAAYIWKGWLNLLLGRPAAGVEAAERSVQLDPLAPAALVFLAEAYLANGQTDEALAPVRRGLQLQPDHPFAHFTEALVLHHLGRFEEARDALRRARSLVPLDGRVPDHTQIDTLDALSAAASGELTPARDLLASLARDQRPVETGLLLAALDRHDEALDALELVPVWGQLDNEYLRYFFPRILDPLRETPRFDALLAKADASWGLPDGSASIPR